MSATVTQSGGLIFSTLWSAPQRPTTTPAASSACWTRSASSSPACASGRIGYELDAAQQAAAANVADHCVRFLQLRERRRERVPPTRSAFACNPSSSIARSTARPAAHVTGFEP